MHRLLALFATALLFAGCASTPVERVFHSRIYNLSTGEVIEGISRTNRAGHSLITAGPSKSGETFSGEATSIDNAVHTSTRGGATLSTPGVPFDTFVRNSSYSTERPGYQNGSAILVGDQGTVIEAVYRVSLNGHGEGEGRDNKGVLYRVQFSQR